MSEGSAMSILGAHDITGPRSFAVQRVLGVFITLWAFAFGWTIVLTGGMPINTTGWKPLLSFAHGYTPIGGVLILAGLMAIIGLSIETNRPHHVLPRLISLASCVIGAAWCGIAMWAFIYAWVHGYPNAGAFQLAVPLFVFICRFMLLVDIPNPSTTTLRAPMLVPANEQLR